MSKAGRPRGINFDHVKTIKLNEDQAKKWNPKEVKNFLDGNTSNQDSIILKKLIPAFIEKGIKIPLEDHEIERIKQLWSEINNE